MAIVQTFKNTLPARFLSAVDLQLDKPVQRAVTFEFDKPVLARKGEHFGIMVWEIDGVPRADLVKRRSPMKLTRRSRRRWRHKIAFDTLAIGRERQPYVPPTSEEINGFFAEVDKIVPPGGYRQLTQP